jgi:parallel beta-helix repeat protein
MLRLKNITFSTSINFIIFNLLFVASILQISNACTSDDIKITSASSSSYNEIKQTIELFTSVTCTIDEVFLALQNKESSQNLLIKDGKEPKSWILNAHLLISNGGKLNIFGGSIGNVDSLKLLSTGIDEYVTINASWGQVEINQTFITSWDPQTNGPDMVFKNIESNERLEGGRAYIRVRSLSEYQESRLDVLNSEISFLGYFDFEAWGITWKVTGHDFDRVAVYGDMRNSFIHHNFRGHYSWGAKGSVIDNNEVSFSDDYGLDPHDDSDFFIITNNYIHDNVGHGVICSKRCDNIVISNNIIENNRNGIMLHEEITNSVVSHNTVFGSRNTGIVIYDSSNNHIYNNVVYDNFIGIRALVGAHYNIFENNQVYNSERYGLFVSKGSLESKSGNARSSNNTFRNNIFTNNHEEIFFLESDHNLFEDNVIEGQNQIFVKNAQENTLNNNFMSDENGNDLLYFKSRNDTLEQIYTELLFKEDIFTDLDKHSSIKIKNDHNQLIGFLNNTDFSISVTKQWFYISLNSSTSILKMPLTILPIKVTTDKSITISNISTKTNSFYSWSATLSEDNQNVEFNLTDLAPNSEFKVFINNIEYKTVSSTSDGILRFSDTNKKEQEHGYRLVRVIPTKKSSGSFSFLFITCILIVLLRRKLILILIR